jgi:hypothetical protein
MRKDRDATIAGSSVARRGISATLPGGCTSTGKKAGCIAWCGGTSFSIVPAARPERAIKKLEQRHAGGAGTV